jgi:Cu2+-exporting ATPase
MNKHIEHTKQKPNDSSRNARSITNEADKLCVSCGCDSEAKQYEYKIHDSMPHKEHSVSNIIYTCPMHPKVKSKEPGRCSVCGMELIAKKIESDHADHDMSKMSHHDHEAAMSNPQIAKNMEKDMKRRFFISLLLSIPIFILSPVGINLLKIPVPEFLPVNWILLALTTPVVFWAGSIFITGTYYSLKAKKLNMSVLIATGVLAAYIFSVLLTFIGTQETFYEASALLVTFVLFGHWMEMKSRRGTSEALRALFDLIPSKSKVIRNGKEIEVNSSDIIEGDVVVLRPGDKVPVDGIVIKGESAVDESLVTGESIPVSKSINDKVIGGSVNQTGTIQFKAAQVGSDTVLANIIKLVETAQNSKAPGQRIADKAAAWLVVLAIVSGFATFFGWYFFAGATLLTALTFAISAVVIACPDALGLATPTAVAVGTGIGAKKNILIKDAATLENVSKINAIVLDKTGTLTEGKPKVTDIITLNRFSEKDVLRYAASVEANSNHPFSKAILEEAKKQKIFLDKKVTGFKSLEGLGLEARVDGKRILIGTTRLMKDNAIGIENAQSRLDLLFSSGKTVSLIARDKTLIGVIAVSDPSRASAEKTIRALKSLGIEVAMITGDHKQVAESVGNQLGIDRVFAEVLPQDKAMYVKKLQDEGKFVAMVGDGINDAPALAQSDIGIAIGAGTDVAIETGNVVLMKSDPYDIVKAIVLSKATVRKMKQNLFWAAIYNVLAIPVAAGAFYTSFGISLRPEISALLMSVSSIIVAGNAVLLKRVESKLGDGGDERK